MRSNVYSGKRPALLLVWEQFSAYHIDRLEALGRDLCGEFIVVGVEIAPRSQTYSWAPVQDDGSFVRHVLFPDAIADEVPWWSKLRAIIGVIRRYRVRGAFLCNQERPEILAAIVVLRLLRVPAYAMLDAKFDDSPRRVFKESLKQLVFRLYSGGLVAGRRHADYYRFLGMPAGWSVTGYDTISIDRICRQAKGLVAPDGPPHAERDFVVIARFVPKKNLTIAIRAFARYRAASAANRRRLVLCGSGPLDAELRALVAELGVPDVVFTGFLGPEAIAEILTRALALVLPSVEEQWGLVVNEAVALGIPVLCSDNVGARDTLVRTGVNGFVFEPENFEGLSTLMQLLSADAELWRSMALSSRKIATQGDVAAFVAGVRYLVSTSVSSKRN